MRHLDGGQHTIRLVLDRQGRDGLPDQIVRTAAEAQTVVIEQVDPAVELLHEPRELGAPIHRRSLIPAVGAATCEHLPGFAADQLHQCRRCRSRSLWLRACGSLRPLRLLCGRSGRPGPGIDADGSEGPDLDQAVGVLGVDQLIDA